MEKGQDWWEELEWGDPHPILHVMSCTPSYNFAKILPTANKSNEWGRSRVRTISYIHKAAYREGQHLCHSLSKVIFFSPSLSHQSFIRFLNSEKGGAGRCCCRHN